MMRLKSTLLCIAISLLCISTPTMAWPDDGFNGASVRYSGASPGSFAPSVPNRYQMPMNTGPGVTPAQRRATDYYYSPFGGGYRSPGGGGYYPPSGSAAASPSPKRQPAAPRPRPTTATTNPYVNLQPGETVKQLPPGYDSSAFNGVQYHYHSGVYFIKSGTVYEVVKPPLGISVDSLPIDANQIKPALSEFKGVYYRPSYENGGLVYVVSNP